MPLVAPGGDGDHDFVPDIRIQQPPMTMYRCDRYPATEVACKVMKRMEDRRTCRVLTEMGMIIDVGSDEELFDAVVHHGPVYWHWLGHSAHQPVEDAGQRRHRVGRLRRLLRRCRQARSCHSRKLVLPARKVGKTWLGSELDVLSQNATNMEPLYMR